MRFDVQNSPHVDNRFDDGSNLKTKATFPNQGTPVKTRRVSGPAGWLSADEWLARHQQQGYHHRHHAPPPSPVQFTPVCASATSRQRLPGGAMPPASLTPNLSSGSFMGLPATYPDVIHPSTSSPLTLPSTGQQAMASPACHTCLVPPILSGH